METLTLNASMKGASPEFKKDETTGEDYINGFDVDSPGFGGYGGAMDLGISYKPNERLTFSASALDLGYISWNKEATTTAVSSGEFLYNGFNGSRTNSGSKHKFCIICIGKI